MSFKSFIKPALIFLMAVSLCHADSLRPPSVPLVACDPYFSIWSPADKLTDADTVHWTGKKHRLTGLVRIDGKTFRLLGAEPTEIPPLTQTNLKVLPTRTIYSFTGAGVDLELTFMTPALPQDLMVYSRPVTYITWSAKSADSTSHDVQVYLDAATEITVNDERQPITWAQPRMKGLNVISAGSQQQAQLRRAGDDVRIDWGHLYLVAAENSGSVAEIAPATNCRQQFQSAGKIKNLVVPTGKNIAAADAPVLAISLALPKVTTQSAVTRFAVLAYDDEVSIQYFGMPLRPYWRRDGATAEDLLKLSVKDYARLCTACAEFDAALLRDAEKTGGESYSQICALAYRQCVAGCKLVADANGQPLLFLKENFSNGCIGTVDVLYPMAPQFLLFSPSLTKAMLVPILDYASSSRWKFPYAPHDLGTYPHADGQVYGGGERTEKNQMPVEESGNMIILLDALAHMEGDAKFAEHYWPVLEKWAAYLKAKGFDPENQLCTDDFAGHLAHNVNLSAKAIIALAAFGHLCEMRGDHAGAVDYKKTAAEFAARWVQESADGDHTRLAFDRAGTWSQKYNLVWDRLLGLGLFPDEVRQREIDFYKRQQKTFGVPLDNRELYTKLDWTIWSASLATNPSDFTTLVEPVYRFINASANRVPLTDWFMTTDARMKGFQARPVVGGVFLPMLYNQSLWKKWAGRDESHPANWATLPEMKTLVSAADRQNVLWKYTFEHPPETWATGGFDDSQWPAGAAGFGTGRDIKAGTEWHTDDIWLRREIELPQKIGGTLALWMYHDDNVEVYLNGELVLAASGWIDGYQMFPLSHESQALVRPGKNTLAVHCHQSFGGQYIDLGVVEITAGRPASLAQITPLKLGGSQ